MSAKDKLQASVDDLKSKAKEAVGKLTDDDKKVAEGKAEQVAADLKKAGENVKDSFEDIG
ncbi:MAG TPA: CsbD family protein [Microbacteriaceae bacterium]|nr:CsbD family protein [Microbacteriaceae bacterium]